MTTTTTRAPVRRSAPAAPRGGAPGRGGRPTSGRGGGRPPARPAVRRRPGDPDRRAGVLMVAVLAVLALFVVRLALVQGSDASTVAAQAVSSRTVDVPLPASRGEITAADGSVLAASFERRDVVVDQTLVPDFTGEVDGEKAAEPGPAGAAALIAPLVGRDEGEVRAILTGDARWAVVAEGATPATWRRVQALGIPGIASQAASQRSYPSGSVAGNLIGWVGSDGTPLAGLEIEENEVLQGRDGTERYERGRDGQRIPMAAATRTDPVDGADVRLTVDRDLQWYAQQAIEEQVAGSGAEWGAVTVMDPETFEVLALAESGALDPNDPGATAPEMRGNRSLQDSFEPGSTAKVITAAAALEEGVTTPGERLKIPYRYTVPNGQTFQDSHAHDLENLTFAGVLGESSNTGTVMVGSRMSDDVRHDYQRRFGLGERTALDFPGESAGILHAPGSARYDGRTRYATMFGQGMSATMLQSAQVFATIANGGVRQPTHVVAGTTGADGRFVPTPLGPPVRVVSEKTADEVVSMLEGAVGEGGTGESAAVPGYRVAGKTGTAQIAGEGGYEGNGYVASFVGMAPAEDPQVVVAVSVARPQKGYYGGQVAGPVFSDVMSYALAERRVPPSRVAADPVPLTW